MVELFKQRLYRNSGVRAGLPESPVVLDIAREPHSSEQRARTWQGRNQLPDCRVGMKLHFLHSGMDARDIDAEPDLFRLAIDEYTRQDKSSEVMMRCPDTKIP